MDSTPESENAAAQEQKEGVKPAKEPINELVKFGLDNFDAMDKDQNGWLTYDEIKSAFTGSEVGNKNLQLVDELAKNSKKIGRLSNDEYGPEDSGVTRDDIRALLKYRDVAPGEMQQDEENNKLDFAAKESIVKLCQFAKNNFAKIDKDNNGWLSEKEITAAEESSSFTGNEAKLLRALKTHIDKIQVLSNDEYGSENSGITVKDLDLLEESANNMYDQIKIARDIRNTIWKHFPVETAICNVTQHKLRAAMQMEAISDSDKNLLETTIKRWGAIEIRGSREQAQRRTGPIGRTDLDNYIRNVRYQNSDILDLAKSIQI